MARTQAGSVVRDGRRHGAQGTFADGPVRLSRRRLRDPRPHDRARAESCPHSHSERILPSPVGNERAMRRGNSSSWLKKPSRRVCERERERWIRRRLAAASAAAACSSPKAEPRPRVVGEDRGPHQRTDALLVHGSSARGSSWVGAADRSRSRDPRLSLSFGGILSRPRGALCEKSAAPPVFGSRSVVRSTLSLQVPIYVLVLGFKPKYAIPLSNMTVLGGGFTNVFMNAKKQATPSSLSR